jgi:hypothetical protein
MHGHACMAMHAWPCKAINNLKFKIQMHSINTALTSGWLKFLPLPR